MGNIALKRTDRTCHGEFFGSLFAFFAFMLLSFMTVKFLAPDLGSNAATQNASETVGPYTLSMSNDSVANVDITPTASQQIFTTTNNLTLSNSCSQGATISISTNSTSSNDLTRNGTDSATKTIPATTGSSLLDNTWGFSTDGGTTYNPVPMKGGTATQSTIYWRWVYENGTGDTLTANDATDTALGFAANTAAPEVEIVATVTATQVD
jgi:hypothetical protein